MRLDRRTDMHRRAVKNGPKGCGMRGWEKHAYLRHASTFEGEAGTMLAANTKTEYLREPGTKYYFKFLFCIHCVLWRIASFCNSGVC